MSIAEITGLSVSDDINIPIEISALPSSSIPKSAYIYDIMFTLTYDATIISKITVGAKPIAKTASAAKNLPSTIDVRLTGAVSSAWSTFCRLSSLIRRIVSTGMVNTITVDIATITVAISGLP